MPTRTEIVITFGEVLDCLPPGKSYNRKRYNSFDANIGPVEGNEENQENLAPASGAQPCRDMRPEHQVAEEPEPVLSLRARRATNSLTCDETDDEISFRDIKLNGDSPDDGKNKSKRKSNAERFLEDNANYFQLEVLTSKTRSNKLLGGDEGDSDEGDGKGGFHTSFLDFLKSKGVEKEASGRSRHKSADSDVGERPASRATHGRSKSSHSRFGRSKSSARSANGRERSLSRGRSRLLSGVDGSEVFMSESESECSVKLARLEVGRRASARSVSPAESSETSGRGRRGRSRGRDDTSESEAELSLSKGKRSKSSVRDTSPSGSEAEVLVRSRRGKSAVRDVSVTESEYETPPQTPVSSRRGKSPSMDLSLSESEHEAPTTRSRRGKSPVRDASPSESEHEVTASRSRRGKTSERDLSPGSEADAPAVRSKRGKSLDLSLSESEAEVPTTRSRRGKSRDVSPSESEAEAPTTRSRRGKSHDRDVSLSESEAEAPTTRSRLGKSRDVSPSESEASLPTSRTRKGKSPPKDEASESEVETPVRTRRSKSSAREPRDISLSESEPDIQPRARNSRSSARDVSPTESEAELPVRTRRGARREVSPSGSEASLASSTSRTKHDKTGAKESDAESDEEQSKPGKNVKKKGKETPQKNKNKKKRSELDKLLEAVDTSFHFETAAAERKRMNDSGLGPLEIDCSDTGSEASCNISNKRKFSEMEIGSNKKKCKESNNLLKTASPGSALKSEDLSGDELESVTGPAWDGWDALNSQLELISDDPVEISKMHFSFESVPMKESWYSTYQRQDRGDELVFYPTSTTAPFLLPYEMPYNTFQSSKPGRRDTDTSRDQSKASSPVRQLGSLNKKGRKISECESTDSEETRRGKGRTSKASSTTSSTTLDKLGPKGALLLDTNYRVSPRCHASTKSLVTGGLPGDLDDLAEAYLMQDERELHFPNFLPMLQSEENSNDSFSSGSVNSRVKSESSIEMSKLAASLDTLMQNPEELPCNILSPSTPAKVPPTRSRVSSDQLLSPKKAKKKKKLSAETDQAGVSPLDQLVADNVDPVLLDCLEDELPTVSCPSLEDPMDMLDTYSTCTSMSVCNSRWLKPNKRDSLLSSQQKEPKLENKPKKLPSPSKPKRIIIYKDDLPGFSIDSDMEAEKLPVSKRGKAKAQTDNDKQEEEEEKKVKSPPKKDSKKVPLKKNDKKEDFKKTPEKKSAASKEIDDMLQSDDDDSESVESFNSTSSGSKKRRRTNKTGFPSPKKKKKADSTKNSPSEKSPPANQTKPIKSKTEQKQVFNKSSAKSEKPKAEKPKPNSEKTKQSSDEPKPTPKKTVSKQLKMDRFITAKSTKKTPASDKSKPSSSSPVVPLVAGRRSVALKAKNYR